MLSILVMAALRMTTQDEDFPGPYDQYPDVNEQLERNAAEFGDPIWVVWLTSLVVVVLIGVLVVLALGGFPKLPENRRRPVALTLVGLVAALGVFMVVFERVAV